MINSSSNQTLSLHDHPSPTHSRSYGSLHPQQQNMLLNNMILPDGTPAAASFNPTECLEMSDVIAGGGGGATVGTTAAAAAAGQSEHYIYVTYPPELKRRLLER